MAQSEEPYHDSGVPTESQHEDEDQDLGTQEESQPEDTDSWRSTDTETSSEGEDTELVDQGDARSANEGQEYQDLPLTDSDGSPANTQVSDPLWCFAWLRDGNAVTHSYPLFKRHSAPPRTGPDEHVSITPARQFCTSTLGPPGLANLPYAVQRRIYRLASERSAKTFMALFCTSSFVRRHLMNEFWPSIAPRSSRRTMLDALPKELGPNSFIECPTDLMRPDCIVIISCLQWIQAACLYCWTLEAQRANAQQANGQQANGQQTLAQQLEAQQ